MRLHRGRDQQWRSGGERDGGEQIVGEAMREAGDGVGCGWRNQQQVGFAAKLDMARRSLAGWLPEVRLDGTLAERGERKRADEALGVLS